MQSFKIENFVRENPGLSPPRFQHLTDSEASALAERLLTRAGRPKGTPSEVIRWLSEQATPLGGLNLNENEVALHELFRRAGIKPGPVVYVEWGTLSDVDRFETDELGRYFYDVWYPSADDIEIFDDTTEWLIFIRHYGGVEVWQAR
jgi:hypothetical protein